MSGLSGANRTIQFDATLFGKHVQQVRCRVLFLSHSAYIAFISTLNTSQ